MRRDRTDRGITIPTENSSLTEAAQGLLLEQDVAVVTMRDGGPVSAPRRRDHRETWFLAIVLILALGIRLFATAHFTGFQTPPYRGSDDAEYDTYAWNLAQGHGYRGPSPDVKDPNHLTAYRAPVPSLFYAGIYRVFGHNYAAARLGNCLLSVLTVLLVYLITLRCFDRRAARLAAVMAAFYPMSLFFSQSLYSEATAAFLVCLFVWCCLPINAKRGLAWAIGAGIVYGLLLLTKPWCVLLVPLLPLWAWLVFGKPSRLWLRPLALLGCATAVLIPWIVRNQIVMGAPIPFSTCGGSVILQSNNRLVVLDPLYYGSDLWDTYLPEYAPAIRATNNEIIRDRVSERFGIQWLRANPDKWFYLLRGKLLRLWIPIYFGTDSRMIGMVTATYYGGVLLLFLLFLPFTTHKLLKERHPGLILLAMIGATQINALIFYGSHRFRYPIDCLLICLAMGGVSWAVKVWPDRRMIADKLRASVTSHRAALAACAVLGLGLIAWTGVDMRHIQAYRDQECRRRLENIRVAVIAYRAAEGRLPAQLADLVPKYLPDAEALHCPVQSLAYHDYKLLGSTDMKKASRLVSYKLVLPAHGTGGFFVVERGARHPDGKFIVNENGEFVRPRALRQLAANPGAN